MQEDLPRLVISPMIEQVSKSTFPILYGAPETVDGYCTLELIERDHVIHAMRIHRVETALWYQAIKLLKDGMEGTWSIPDEEPGSSAVLIAGQLVGLEVSSAKVALDSMLSGYYSLGFAAIRHMIESAVHARLLVLNHSYVRDWQVDGHPLGMQKAVSALKKELIKTGITKIQAEQLDSIYRSWSLMAKGSHPSWEGLLQVRPTTEDPQHVVGASYRESLAYVGIDHGLWALAILLVVLQTLGRGDEAWRSRYAEWQVKQFAWSQSVREREDLSYLRNKSGGNGPDLGEETEELSQ
jgi:hypothetical protein